MNIGVIIFLVVVWNGMGLIFCCIEAAAKMCDNMDFFNPCWLYCKHSSVNWFGAIMLCILFTILCPIGAICYWFYKLCTVGRRSRWR